MAKHPIIANGEIYAEPVSKALGGGKKIMPRDYFEAKQRIMDDLNVLTQDIIENDEFFLDEKIICIRLEPKFEAKSYIPTILVSAMADGVSKIVGGRKYTIPGTNDILSAKLYFVRTTDNGINQLRATLQSGERDSVEQWQHQIQSIHTINSYNQFIESR